MATPTIMSWPDASILADSMGSDVQLVTIRDAAENQWVYDNFDGTNHIYWIGYTDQTVEGTWVWSSGELSSYTNWATGQPDDGNSSQTQDFAVTGGAWGLNWDDVEDGAADYIAILEHTGPMTFYVDGTGNGDYLDIQSAIDYSIDGDTVIVRDGTYYEFIDFNGKAITLQSENGSATTIIDGSNTGTVVTFNSGEESDSVFSGFTVANGNAANGGGLQCYNSSPLIDNCVFQSNIAGNDGGGAHFDMGASATVANCTFQDNETGLSGGGLICLNGSNLTISNCAFLGNSSSTSSGVHFGGGGLSNWNCTISLEDCIIDGNTSAKDGGGLYSKNNAITNLVNCSITNNEAILSGGGVSSIGSTSQTTLSGCSVSGNTAGLDGGGMQVVDDGTINIEFSDINNNQAGRDGGGLIVIANFNIVDSEFINNISNLNGSGIWMENMHAQQDIARCLFTGNESITSGGAIYMDNISPTLTNVTISGNYAVFQTGIYADGNITPSNPIIRNCIIWDDTIFTYNSFPVYEYSCIEGSYAGTDVINTDPLFVDQATGNYHLLPASPCIDTGDPNSPLDDDGSRADMGAFTSGVDSDSDGLSDINEVTFGTDPFDQDTDDDGLSDGEEVYIFFTDPLMVDTDSDGMQDGTEVGNDTWWLGEPWNGIGGTDTSINIPDADPSTTTDPLDDDTDNDGLMDGQEDANQDGEFLGIELDPNNFDGDNDGLGDGLELGLAAPNGNDTDMTVFVADADPSTTTRATLRDTDGGGIDDGIEDANRNGRIDAGEIDPRDASDDSVYLKHNGASVGGHTTLNFYACEPGSWMFLCYSLAGPGPTSFTNVTLELTQPIGTFSSIRIDSNGNGKVGPLPVPASVSVGDQAWFQGVQVSIFGTSTVLTTTNMTPLTIQ